MLFISPPFGNYLSFEDSMSIKGSYTLHARSGLFLQILKTLRYSFENKGWINKIGLRNKGIDYGLQHYRPEKDIISIAIMNHDEIKEFKKKIPDDVNLELNISCPNTEKHLINQELQCFLNDSRRWCILKVSPLCKMIEIDEYYQQGFRQFHCSNTLPVENGGLSGPTLIPFTLRLVQKISKKYPDVEIIAGGGVRNKATADLYLQNGANHISVSTLCFNPILLGMFFYSFK